jgi:hypothetical protein
LHNRPPGPGEAAVVQQLAADFTASGHDFKALVSAIVTSTSYRRLVR